MKRMLLSLFATLLFVVALPVLAVNIDPTPEVKTFSGATSKEAIPAKFKLHLVVTDSDAQLQQWLAVPQDQRAKLQTRKFHTNQLGHAALVLTEYDMSGLNPVGLEAEVRLYGPDGKLIYTHPDLARTAWGQPKKGYLALLPQVEFTFDAKDAKGKYTYEAIVRDRATNEVARAEFEIELQ